VADRAAATRARTPYRRYIDWRDRSGGALVDGLEEDVRRRWPTCFHARRSALERLTGTVFRPSYEWRVGQHVFDDRWWRAFEGVAANWRDWLAR
jgi:hypothetical protein